GRWPLPTDHYFLLCRVDADEFAAPPFFLELAHAGDEREEGVVAAAPDVVARLEAGAALADQNLAAQHRLAAEALHAQPLGIRIAPVARTAYAFFVCHNSSAKVRSPDSEFRMESERQRPPAIQIPNR